MAQLRKNIHWILDEGQLIPFEREILIPIIVEVVPPEIGRPLLIDWETKEPENLTPVKLLFQLELRAGHYAAAIKEMEKTLKSVSSPPK